VIGPVPVPSRGRIGATGQRWCAARPLGVSNLDKEVTMPTDDIAANSLPKSCTGVAAIPIRLILHLAYGRRGERLHGKFETHLNGRQLCISRQPLLDGARILLAEGIDPETPIVTRHAGAGFDAMISTVLDDLQAINDGFTRRYWQRATRV
jgi:hypothetical protein